MADMTPSTQVCVAVGGAALLLALLVALFGPAVYRACAYRPVPPGNAHYRGNYNTHEWPKEDAEKPARHRRLFRPAEVEVPMRGPEVDGYRSVLHSAARTYAERV